MYSHFVLLLGTKLQKEAQYGMNKIHMDMSEGRYSLVTNPAPSFFHDYSAVSSTNIPETHMKNVYKVNI